ncbi:type III restriction endonuclease subunit R [Helicobacter pylori]|nr:type III restriction endonuclease subunit R [Helicobacter pylori]
MNTKLYIYNPTTIPLREFMQSLCQKHYTPPPPNQR